MSGDNLGAMRVRLTNHFLKINFNISNLKTLSSLYDLSFIGEWQLSRWPNLKAWEAGYVELNAFSDNRAEGDLPEA